ncbi:MAG: ABC transporter ATP-binding protein/permease [Bacilli bacterium]|nr:ABC transporter ATP-binding protein/permease [Bacilli bacterium]
MIKTIMKLNKQLGKYKKDIFITWAFVIIETICEIAVPTLTGWLVNVLKGEAVTFFSESIVIWGPAVGIDLTRVFILGGAMVLIAALAVATGIGAGWYCAQAACGIGHNIRKAMYERIQKYSFNNIDKFSTSSIVTRMTTDITNVQFAYQMTIRAALRAPLLMIFAMTIAFTKSWQLALIFISLTPVVAFFLLLITNKVHPIFVDIFDTYDNLNQEIQEDVAGMRAVKAFTRQEEQKKKFGKVSLYIYKRFVKAERIIAFNNPLLQVMSYTASLLICYLGAFLIKKYGQSYLSTGDLTSLLTYVFQIMFALFLLSMVYVQVIIARNSAERVVEILEEESDIVSPENAVTTIANGEVIFDNVTFHYNANPDHDVLRNINIAIPSGSTVGIVGSTGSSKTSLLNLIARLYDVSSGSVKVGGVDVREYNIEALRDAVAVVLQKNVLFTGSIRENLLWGNKDATQEDIEKACKMACASEFIERFPDKYETMLDEGGTNVSGGQRQRLCIARALLKNPKILILDDSTSAVDTHTDATIRGYLKDEKPEVTKFIVAERVLSVKDCDIILVMENGEIVAKGNSEELYATCQIYKELVDTQLGGGDFDVAN